MRLPRAKIGIVPLVFANADLPDLTGPLAPEGLLEEIARLGFQGTQLSRALPSRGLKIAEVYAAIPCTVDGPPDGAREQALALVERAKQVDSDVLVFSYHLSAERVGWAGRAAGAPSLTADGRKRAVELVDDIARRFRLSYHPHAGTFVETPSEVEWLMEATAPELVGLCLDVGHYIVGGGDPVEAIRRYGARVRHVHMKDVDANVLRELRSGALADFFEALRARIFTELGSGVLDVSGVLRELARFDYDGWLMCEQDTTWRPPAESAAVSRAVLGFALRD